jgi:hypothetical protein
MRQQRNRDQRKKLTHQLTRISGTRQSWSRRHRPTTKHSPDVRDAEGPVSSTEQILPRPATRARLRVPALIILIRCGGSPAVERVAAVAAVRIATM